MTLILILSHLLAAALGALAIAVYAMFLLAAAIWSAEEEEGGDRGPVSSLPTPTDPPSSWKLDHPSARVPFATPSSSPAPASAQSGSAPADMILPAPPPITSVRRKGRPLNSSAAHATSAPSSGPAADTKPRASAILLDGPFDGLAVVLDPTIPARIQSTHGPHLYVPTDRFDLNRRVFRHIGPAPLP